MNRRLFLLAASAPVLLGPTGCGKSDKRVPVVQTTGKLVWTGHSVHGLLMVFHPADPAMPKTPVQPTGVVKKDGTFTVNCYDTSDGLPPGDYVVTIRDAPRSDSAPMPTMPPAKFLDKDLTPFRAKIEKKPSNDLPPFEITP